MSVGRTYWRYAIHLLRHKWLVVVAGVRLRVPLWRLLVHDWSKFLPSEWGPYAFRLEHGTEDEIWYAASLQHIHRNPHHWEHWCHVDASGVTHPIVMPEAVAREMVADWRAASRMKGTVVRVWYAERGHLIVLHPTTRVLVESLLRAVP